MVNLLFTLLILNLELCIMIAFFNKITGTGKFLNYQKELTPDSKQMKDFQHFNLIYGENGSGKTTLALTLRSLKGDDELLLKKRSFDKSVPQEVAISMKGGQHFLYHHSQWNGHLNGLEIFDVFFINENIYTGLEIQNDHKKKLFEVMLGEQGVKLKEDIQHLKLRIRNGRKIIREAGRDIEKAIGDAFTADEYALMSADPYIEEQIAEKQQELNTARNMQRIRQQSMLLLLPLFRLPYSKEETHAVLQTSIENISEEYLKKIQTHKEHLGLEKKAEEWLSEGYSSIQDNSCPFCQQDLSEAQIIQAYHQYFNQTYKKLLQKIADLQSGMESYNLKAFFLDLEGRIKTNDALIQFWKTYLPVTPKLDVVLQYKEALEEGFNQVKLLIQKKSRQPVEAQPLDTLKDFEKIAEQFAKILNEVNEKITSFNENIALLKADESLEVIRVETELKKLEALKKRGDLEIERLCQNLIKYNKGINHLQESVKEKQQALRAYENTIFLKQLNKINSYLKAFAPYLSIQNLSSGYMGSSTEPVVKFILKVNGQPVKHKEHASQPSIKYALSEGDKCALALAFFFSRLELDEKLSDKVIVFDDSVSSFDQNRTELMLNYLFKLGKKACQLFFLTHNLNLAEEFWRKTQQDRISFGGGRIGFYNNSSFLFGNR